MIAIIAEKPSVGQAIARVVGATEKHTGYMQGNGYFVTWAVGHLVGLALPGAYANTDSIRSSKGAARVQGGTLPIIPDPFQLIVRQKKQERRYVTDGTATRQLNIISKVLDQSTSIIVATDSSREGEIIFRFIYAHTASSLPFKRLWISSLTKEAIIKGMENLRDGAEYDNLFHAAECRAKADWLTGLNASIALARVAGGSNHSLGRVQTPTLGMICSRYLEHRNFHPINYWHLYATLTKNGALHKLRMVEDIRTDKRAEEFFEQIKACPEAIITKVETKRVQEPPPLLYDLTALQKECNVYFDMTAERTLEVAQALYERGLISYPRTASRYLTPDIAPQIPSLLRMILRMEQFAHFESSIDVLKTSQRNFNAAKVTDHHALILTGYFACGLSEQETLIYDLIAGRMLEAFSPKCEKESSLIEATIGRHLFRSQSTTVTASGWRGVYNRAENEEQEEQPSGIELCEGESVAIGGWNKVQKLTKARPLLTEATLLGAMERSAKGENYDHGIGTPATRAAIISTLFERQYIERSGRSLVPTEKGLYVYRAVKDMRIADAQLTAGWERSLAMVESGEMSPETFMNSIITYTRQVTAEVLSLKIPKEQANLPACPKCKQGGVVVRHKVAKCNGDQCGFILYRRFLNKELSDQNVGDLLLTGKTKLIKGFEGKRNNTFDAYLTFDPNFNVTFLFPEKPKAVTAKSRSKSVAKPKPRAKSKTDLQTKTTEK